MPEGLLGILKLCLIALIYLFFLRIVWAVAAELRAPVASPNSAPSAGEGAPATERKTKGRKRNASRATTRLTLVVNEPPELLGRRFDLDGEITVGRAAGCRIALDDSFVSTMHARLFLRDGIPWLEDLGSTNGSYVNDVRVEQPVELRKGDRVRFGQTMMSVVAS